MDGNAGGVRKKRRNGVLLGEDLLIDSRAVLQFGTVFCIGTLFGLFDLLGVSCFQVFW